MILSWVNPLNGQLKPKTSAVIIVMLCSIILIGNRLFSKPTVGIVDVNRIKGNFIRSLAEHQFSTTKVKKVTALFNESLAQGLKDYASSHGVILVKKGSVLSFDNKPTDLTDDVMKTVIEKMRTLSHG